MTRKAARRKIIGESSEIRCASGKGIIREEVWTNPTGAIERYNLAFINPALSAKDNGRVLGYDNSHGHHHRHFKGTTTEVESSDFLAIRARFVKEVAALKQEKP